MKHSISLTLSLLMAFIASAQINFEQGYYIDNSGKKINCLIRNMDWRGNPTSFQYKITAETRVETTDILQVQEFGIGNQFKFQRSAVMIDRSSDLNSELSNQRAPEFKTETLFLKVLVEGAANLYQYEGGNVRRFFYSITAKGSEIKPLIFKRYRQPGRIGINYQFRQQLTNEFNCAGFSKTAIDRMEYKRDLLLRFFDNYNKCIGGTQVLYKRKKAKNSIRLTPRIGLNYAKFSMEQSSSAPFPFSRNIDVEFDGKFYPRFGLEFEIALPFGGNKWRLFVDPSYQSYSEKSEFIQNINSTDIVTTSEIKYATIEFPVGVRHYFYINDNSQLFANASVAFVFNSTSTIDFEVEGQIGEIADPVLNGTEEYFSAGLGYLLNNKWSLEARYNTSRDLLGDTTNWTSKFDNSFSLILGYNLL